MFPCISTEVLIEFLSGRLEKSAALDVATHFNTCAACQVAADAMTSGRELGSDPADVGPSDTLSTLDSSKVDFHVPGRSPTRRAQTSAEQSTRVGLESVPEGLTSISPRSVFAREFLILGEIARGGMGVVYKARQLKLNRIVALKMVAAGQAADDDEIRRFRAEAEAVGRLDHPNIVPVYDTGDYDRQHYLIMGYVDGGSLKGRLAAGPLAPFDAAKIILAVARAVDYAHQKGIIHRDLKPSNILLDSQGQPRITDFGLAKRLHEAGDMTTTGQIMGTPGYMPPEQALGRSELIGPESDVYSLGATLYHLLTGRPPFQAATPLETLQQVVQQDPLSPRQLNASIDRNMETICLQCLQKEPANRYRSAAALADELERYLRGETILARPASLLERSLRWCRRKPVLAALAASVVVSAVLLLAGGVLWQRSAAAEIYGEQQRQIAMQQSSLALQQREIAEQQTRLANTQAYFSLVSQIREQSTKRRPGWTWDNLENLEQASQLQVDVRDFRELRTLTADAMSSVDLRQVAVFSDIVPRNVAFSPDNRLLAIAQFKGDVNASVYTYDLETKQRKAVYSFPTFAHNFAQLLTRSDNQWQESIFSLAFSPDQRWLAAGTRHGYLYVWDTLNPDKAPWNWQQESNDVPLPTFSPDSSQLWFSYWYTGKVYRRRWDQTQGWIDQSPSPEVHQSRTVAISPDGRHIAFGSTGIRICDPEGNVCADWLQHPCWNSYLEFTKDGQFLIAPEAGQVKVVDRRNGRVCLAIPESAQQYSTSADGTLLVASGPDGSIRLWDLVQGRLLYRVQVPSAGDESRARISPDGRWLATTVQNETYLYEVRRPGVRDVVGPFSQAVTAATISPDGTEIAVLTEQSSPRLVEPVHTVEESFHFWNIDQARSTTSLDVVSSAEGAVHALSAPAHASWYSSLGVATSSSMLGLHLTQGNGLANALPPAPSGQREIQEDRMLSPEGDPAKSQADSLASNGRASVVDRHTRSVRVRLNDMLSMQDFVDADDADKRRLWSLYAAVRIVGTSETESALTVTKKSSSGETRRSLRSGWPQTSYHFYEIDRLTEGAWEAGTEYTIELGESPQLHEFWIDRIKLVPGRTLYHLGGHGRLPMHGLISIAPHEQLLWSINGGSEDVYSSTFPGMQPAARWSNAMETYLSGESELHSLAAGSQRVAVGTQAGKVILLDATTGKRAKVIGGAETPLGGRMITALAMHPCETHLVAGNEDGNLYIVGLDKPHTVSEIGLHAGVVTALAVTRDGTWLASGDSEGGIRVWNFAQGEYEEMYSFSEQGKAVKSVDFSRDGTKLLVVYRGERGARLWRLDELHAAWKALKL